MTWLTRSLTVSVVSLSVLSAPTEADACSPDPCYDADGFSSISVENLGAVPTDGVISLTYYRGEGDMTDEDAWAMATVTVAPEGGMPIAGTLEFVGSHRLAVFRPDAPLTAGAYTVTVDVDNEALEPVWTDYMCGEPQLHVEATITVTDQGATVPTPTPVGSEFVRDAKHHGLDALVCCDGAFPYSEEYCGFDDIFYDNGTCAVHTQTGFLDVGAGVDALPSEPVASQVIYRAVIDGAYQAISYGNDTTTVTRTGPFCFTIEAIDLRTMEATQSEELCVGDAVADQLGDKPRDVSGELAACQGELYTCNVVDNAWDETDCVPWDEDPTTTSGGTSDSGSESGGTSDSASGSGTDSSSGSASGTDSGSGSDTSGMDAAGRGCSCTTQDGSPAPLALLLGLFPLGILARRRR